jgi:ABC-type maltose transport system permease subunit
MKFCSLFLLSAPLAADAFAPLASPRRTSSSTEMNMAKNDLGLFSDIMRPFGTLAVAASLAFNPIIASAQENNVYQDSSIASSSVQVSETIKVLDMVRMMCMCSMHISNTIVLSIVCSFKVLTVCIVTNYTIIRLIHSFIL